MSGRAKYYSDRPPPREPTPITEVLGAIIESAGGGSFGTGLARLKEDWAAISGETWAGTVPVTIRDGLLIVEVPNGSRASLLRFEADALQARIEAGLGPGLVTGIRLRVARPANPR